MDQNQPLLEEGEKPFLPASSLPPKPRMTVVDIFYHQVFGEQPESVESRFERELSSDEQMYQRKKVATEEWQPIDLGWVKEVGTVFIQNIEGQFHSVNPTVEQKEEIAKRVLEFTFAQCKECFLIPPGESMRCSPTSAGSLMLRCRSGQAKYLVVVVSS
jgi:hypothetical protein